MRLFFTSDLHVEHRVGRRASRTLAEWVQDRGRDSDVLILGGDYGHEDEAIEASLEMFVDFPGTVLAVAGNHDVWGDPDRSSEARLHRLWAHFESLGFHPLGAEPIVVDGVGFVGGMGWYDYSFRDRELDVPMDVYRDKRLPWTEEPVWRDAEFVQWPDSDEERVDRQIERLRDHLATLPDTPEIVAAFHHVPSPTLLRPSVLPDGLPRRVLVPERWLILNTYLGSRRFGDVLAEETDDRVELALCGHIHLARRAVDRGVTFVSNGSDHDCKELIVYDGSHLRRRRFGPNGVVNTG
jgi:predicted phosphohydrolase